MSIIVVDVAREIALKAHGGSINKHNGELYLLHVNRVAVGARSQAMREGVYLDHAEATAWLHDVVEDTAWDFSDISLAFDAAGVEFTAKASIIFAVDLLTKTGGPNKTYYKQIKNNVLATVVKRADMQDNFSRNHKIEDESTRLRMAEKYSLGMEILG